MAGNKVYVQGSYVDIHDNEVVNLAIDKALVQLQDNVLQDFAPSKRNRGGRPKRTGKKITKSFIYNGGPDTNVRLQLLYNGLLHLNWIREDTDLRNFMSLFSGEDTTCRVVWTGDINTLAELFRELVTIKGFVRLPQGESVWVMVNARFWDKEANKEFGNRKLGATRSPIDKRDSINLLVDLMNPAVTIEMLRKRVQSQY